MSDDTRKESRFPGRQPQPDTCGNNDAAVRAERQRFHDVLEMLPVYVILLTPDYHVFFANRFFRERFGESGGRRCYEYLFERTEPCVVCETYTVLKTRKPHRWEWTGPDGRNYDIFDLPFRDANGSRLILEMGIDITNVKRAEEALREANETLEHRVFERTAELAAARALAVDEKNRLEAVMEALPVALSIVDERGGVIKSNKMFEALWGTPLPGTKEIADYAAYRAWWAGTGQPVRPEEWGAARAVIDGETVLGQMIEIESFEGSRKVVMNSAAPVRDAAGKITGSAVAIQDITDLKQTEARLAESKKSLEREKELLQAIMNGAWNSHLVYLDRDFNFVRVNETYACTCGYRAEEMVGKNHFTLYPHEENRRIFEQVRDTGTPVEFHDRPFVFPDQPERGTTYWDWSLIPVRDKLGKVEGLVFSLVETTERKRAEDELIESQTRFKLLSETAGRLLTSDNPRGLVTELCRKVMIHLDCHVFFNYLADERMGKLRLNGWAGIPEEEARKIEWLDYGTAVCGCVAQQCCRIVAEDIPNTPDIHTELVKSYGIRAYACHPLMAGGRLIGTLSFGTRTRSTFSERDLALMKTVTDQVAAAMERIRLIAELQESRDELEMRVQERTVELLKANLALEQSNRDLEDFAHIASHDLQEPLRKIQAFSDRLATGYADTFDGRVRDYFQRMQRAAARMQDLVEDLLRYSRVTSKPRPIARFNLAEVLEEAAADLLMLREETGGRIEIGELPAVHGDRIQIRQLFQNLLGNSLKYRGENPPIVKVYDRSPAAGPFLEIHVRDNGIGFNQEYLEKIFKPFQRLHGRTALYRGTGMGLAICRRIVERHGGNISAESRPGEGATFIVRLPRKE